jgi:hypothetical protein
VRPSVEEVQKMLNTMGNTITFVSKGVAQWKMLEKKKKVSTTEVIQYSSLRSHSFFSAHL